MTSLLSTERVEARYGDVQVLRGVDLAANAGEVNLLVGRNGCGKSTFLKVVAGLVAATGGAIRLDGRALGRASPRQRVLDGIALVPQAGNRGRGVFPHLTVAENLELMALRRDAPADLESIWPIFPDLAGLLRTRAAQLSGGQQQMLAVAMALLRAPKLLLLDEPTSGIARGRATQLLATVRQLARERALGVVIVEQNVMLALDHVDHVHALRAGTIVARVTPEIARDPSWFARVL